MNLEDIPKEDLDKIWDKLMVQKQKEASDTFDRLDKEWDTYTIDMKATMYNYNMCQMIHMITVATRNNTAMFIALAAHLEIIGTYLTAFYLKELVIKEYEKNLTPEVDELKRMMDL